MKNVLHSTSLLPIALIASSIHGHAASYILDDIDGVRIQDSNLDGAGDSVQRNQLWAGNIAGSDWGVVLVFDLPTLGFGEDVVSSANFAVTQKGTSGSPDLLVSVFTRSASAVQAGDYQGAGTGYTSAIVDLETGFGGATNVSHSLTSAGQNQLTTFLNDNKDDDYLFVRIRANGTPVGGQAYQFGSTSSGDWTTAESTLSFATAAVPEPSSAALLGFGSLGLILRRRRA